MTNEQKLPNKTKCNLCMIILSFILSLISYYLIDSSIAQASGLQTDTRPTQLISTARGLTSEQTRSEQGIRDDEPTTKQIKSKLSGEVQSPSAIELKHDVACSKIFLPNGEATIRARYACEILPNRIMLASFHQESGRNPNAKGDLGELGICQVLPQYNPIVKDKRWKTDWKFMVRWCVSKWQSVENHKQIWASYDSNAYRKYLNFYHK